MATTANAIRTQSRLAMAAAKKKTKVAKGKALRGSAMRRLKIRA